MPPVDAHSTADRLPSKGNFVHTARQFIEALFGTSEGRWWQKQAPQLAADLSARIRDVNDRWSIDPATAPTDSPIFVFSAGWRSGSTLLQRMIMSDSSVIIWGEPFDRAGIVQSLANQWRGFTHTWPADDYIAPNRLSAPSDAWIANLYPEVEALRAAQISLLKHLFADSARQRGYERWGVKEVRLLSEHAFLLRWLYPQAKFIFLCRDPVKAYASYKPWRRWFREWPNQPVLTPRAFGRMWCEMVEDYQANYQKVGGLFVRYEDLKSSVGELREYLKLDIASPNDLRVERGDKGDGQQSVSFLEREIIRTVTSPARKQAGYK